jgi:uncharacterized membrane protein YccC
MRANFFKSAETTLVFMARCSLACAVAYEAAARLGVSQPVWAAISAIIVSQERFIDTRSSLTSRIAGTVFGAAIGVAVGALAGPLNLSAAVEVALAVALAAYAAHRFPTLRVAMWTGPVVLLTADASGTLLAVALRRAGEVIFGAMIGFAFHWLAERLVGRSAA